MDAAQRILTVDDLRVEFRTKRGPALAVDGISLHIDRGEVLGVVGESGCGKSVTALSIMRLIDYPGRIVAGRIDLAGTDVLALPAGQMQHLRGERVSMIFQDPTTTLNPVLRIGDQIVEVLSHHRRLGRKEARERATALLQMVGIPSPRTRLGQYPHQMSGGMLQRVVIAIALALEPQLLLADEPTTALDVTIQAEILDVIQRLQQEKGTAMMLITHDIGVVAQVCHRVAVMYAGKIVESGTVSDVVESPAHPYTIGLIRAVPRLAAHRGEELEAITGSVPDIVAPPAGCRFHPRCRHAMDVCRAVEPAAVEWRPGHTVACHLYAAHDSGNPLRPVREPASGLASARRLSPMGGTPASTPAAAAASTNGNGGSRIAVARTAALASAENGATEPLLRVEDLTKQFPAGFEWVGGLPRRRVLTAVNGISFEIGHGEAFGLVGESGCGKSTTARVVMRLYEPTAGRILLNGEDLARLPAPQLFERRRLFQMVFQNPYASLDPRWTVERLIAEPLDVHEALSRAERQERVLGLLSAVSLGAPHRRRYPHQLSGGQRQRVAIARALALNTRLLVADEPVSALDVSIQAQILNLLIRLKEQLNLSLLFISHNLAVVHYLCERVGVMYAGKIVETGPVEEVLRAPRHPYTRVLVSSVPEPTVQARRERIITIGDLPSLLEPAHNCPFHTRCPHAREICRTSPPPPVAVGAGHTASCHLVASGEL